MSKKEVHGMKGLKSSSSIKDRGNEDEFMAAAIGDVEWLSQSMKYAKGGVKQDKSGLAALHLAALHGRLDCVKMLIEKYKQDINLASSTGWKPIHLCISNQTGKRAFAVLEYLLSKGADFAVTNDDGITPMHQAASEGHIQCLKALIERGAKIYVKDYRGHTPLDLAKLWGHRQCARVLATEQWHQEKDEVAKELKQIHKKHMISELENLHLLEDERAGKQFYGADVYKEWLKTRNLKPDSKGKVKIGKSERSFTPTSGLYQPNSIAASRALPSQPGKEATRVDTQIRERSMDTSSTEFYTINESFKTPPRRNLREMDEATKKEIHSHTFFNENGWKFTPQCNLLDSYAKKLEDCYPRDLVTKLPHRNAAPTYLATHKNVPISAYSKPDAYKSERKVVFQPENILDAQTKMKYTEDQMKNRPQVFLNLSSAIDSQLFQRGLYIDPFTDQSSSSVSKSTLSGSMPTPI